ncbi:MAG: T9SS type A sorting domain-containing protein [Bacteroidota bacterium]|nr:T9SS type A sorting domain-containing protein [Bacteroidota bacterium]
MTSQSRNLYLEFPAYVDSSNVNPIARLLIDRFVPAEFELDSDPESDRAPTKLTAQQKFDMWHDRTVATLGTGNRMFALMGDGPENLRDVACLQYVLGRTDANIENSTIATFNYAPLSNWFTATLAWQEKVGTEYYVRLRHMASDLVNSFGIGNNEWGPFQEPPHPVIASWNEFGVLAFVADTGILVSTTINSGSDWSVPSLLDSAGTGSHGPFVAIDTSSQGGNKFLVLFSDPDKAIRLFRSETATSVRLSEDDSLMNKCTNPVASRHGTDLLVGFQYYDVEKNRNYIARKRLDLSTGTIPHDWDAFGLVKQNDRDVHRDPTIIHTDSSDVSKFAMSWNFNTGEKLLWTSRASGPDSVLGFLPVTESVLSSKPTAYPHLLYKDPGYPLLVVSRLGACRGGIWDPGQSVEEDESPSLIYASRGSLPSTITSVTITELGMDFAQGQNRLMHVRLGMPAAVNGVDTIGRIPYDYSASEAFTTEPIDTLTRSLVTSLADGDVVFFPIDITCHRDAADTMIVEVVLYDPASGAEVSSSGEYKLPPFTGDTTLTIGLEMPNGFPPTDCFVSTAIRRGYYTGGVKPTINLCRYMLLGEQTVPKRRVREPVVVARGPALEIHPQPARETLRFAVEGTGDGEAVLMDLLGRRLVSVPLQGDGTAIRGTLTLGGVAPGMYMLVVRTPDMVRTGKVIVAR